jgi:hypothetical protein
VWGELFNQGDNDFGAIEEATRLRAGHEMLAAFSHWPKAALSRFVGDHRSAAVFLNASANWRQFVGRSQGRFVGHVAQI